MTSLSPAGLSNLPLARSGVDRAGHRRTDDLVAALLTDPTTRVLPVAGGRAPTTPGPRSRPIALGLRAPIPSDGDRLAVFLGVDDAGVDYLAVDHAAVGEDESAPPGWAGLREVGSLLDARDAGLLTQAVALLAWHAGHTHCPRCGAPTRVVQAGYARHCDVDGSDHYPRTDPAVIMTVVDGDDRLLLGHQASWPAHRYSTLAGFVEPGEPLEAAVRREVREEAGIVVDRVDYRGSQPWPFPASIMLGFHAYATTIDIDVDGIEIEQAAWFSRPELRAALTSGEVLLPPSVSIARALIEDWYGGPLEDGGGSWR